MTRNMLRLRDVSYRRGGRTVLDHVDLDVAPGTTTAVVGPSGSGKSTLLAILGDLAQPDTGHRESPYTRGETGLVLQAYGLVALLTAAENVEVALQRPGCSPSAVRGSAAEALEYLHLGGVANHLVEELSGGQQQRVAIARALAIRPRLLLADEFTAELDPTMRALTVDLVLSTAEHGTTVVVATHDPAIAARCDHVLQLA